MAAMEGGASGMVAAKNPNHANAEQLLDSRSRVAARVEPQMLDLIGLRLASLKDNGHQHKHWTGLDSTGLDWTALLLKKPHQTI